MNNHKCMFILFSFCVKWKIAKSNLSKYVMLVGGTLKENKETRILDLIINQFAYSN